MPHCPIAAQIAATPLMSPSRAEVHTANVHGGGVAVPGRARKCAGLPVPRLQSNALNHISSSPSGLGALITVTADKMNALSCLKALMRTDSGLRLDSIFVTVDFKNKSEATEAVAVRREWAKANEAELQRMADSLHALAKVPVLIEVIEMHSCMSNHLSQHTFKGYSTSKCGGGAELCTTTGMWKNTVTRKSVISSIRHVFTTIRFQSLGSCAYSYRPNQRE